MEVFFFFISCHHFKMRFHLKMQTGLLEEKKPNSCDLAIPDTHTRPWPLQTALCSPFNHSTASPAPTSLLYFPCPTPQGPPREAGAALQNGGEEGSGFCRSSSTGMRLRPSPRMLDILARKHHHPVFSWSETFSATASRGPTARTPPAVRMRKQLAFLPPGP